MFLRNMTVAAALLMSAGSASAISPGLGEVVTDTAIRTANGQDLTLGDLRGQVVILTFWVTDCEACQNQLKTLDYYYRQRADVGLTVLAVAAQDLSNRQLKAAFKDSKVHPVANLRGSASLDPLDTLPTTYVIDRYGQVRHVATKEMDIQKLNEILVPLLRQPQP